MKRRAFCLSAASALALNAVPLRHAFAAAEGSSEVPAMGYAGKQLVLTAAEVD